MSHGSRLTSLDWQRATPLSQSASLSPASASLRSRSNSRTRASDGRSSKTALAREFVSIPHQNYQNVPPLPQIPAHFLDENNKLAAVNRSLLADAKVTRPSSLHVQRPSTITSTLPRSRHSLDGDTFRQLLQHRHAPSSPDKTRRRSLPTLEARSAARAALEGRSLAGMDLRRKGRNDDLFLQVARDESGLSGTDEEGKEPTFRERIRSRAEKRRSLPADIVHSPLDFNNQRIDDFAYSESPQETSFQPRVPQHMSRYSTSRLRTPSVASSYNPRTENLSGGPGRSRSGHLPRYSIQNDHSPISPSRLVAHTKSPELSHNARRRPSVGSTSPQRHKERQPPHPVPQESASESPADSSEPKQSNGDTESVPSQTAASTVWDELDDLKSRIKKLELTGKWPPSSNATTSFERPRTATTAPTTIDSSPKHERKADSREQTPTNKEDSVSAQDIANAHPLLHNALAKAKKLLNPSLYRSLEATANDALQLSVMSAGTATQSSAASNIGGAAVVDRQLRRKANAMCRNLTDLCLALCDGKHETPGVVASPVVIERPSRQPSVMNQQHAKLSLGVMAVLPDGYRPASRLDARRTSLGLQPLGADSGMYRRSQEDVSASEEEMTPAKTMYSLDQGSIERPASRLLSIRKQTYGDFSGDEEQPIRPPSRAMTDIGSFRKASGRRDYEVNGQERSPTLREALISKRVNAASREGNQMLPRVSSMNSEISRRRYFDRSTPPVLEEGGVEPQPQPQSQSRRRIISLGANQGIRRVVEEPHRAMSFSQRHEFIAE